MSDKIYELLNNAEINTDEYEQIALSEHERKRIKTRFLKENAGMKNKKSYKKIVAAVAVVAICSATVTVGAAVRKALVEKKQTGNMVTVGLNTDEEISVSKLAFEYGYIPEGYSEWKPNYFSKDGEYGGKGFWVRQSEGDDETFKYLENKSEIMVDGKKAYSYEMGEESETVQNVILVEYNDNGLIYGLYSDGISMEELLKVAGGITATETDDTIELNRDREIFYGNSYIDIPEKNIVPVSETITYPEDYEWSKGAVGTEGILTLQSVEITDNVAGLTPEYFWNYEEGIAPYINEDGTFKPYFKSYDVYDDNGVAREYEECGFYVVRAKFALTNMTDQKKEFWPGAVDLTCLEDNGDGWYDYIELLDYKNLNNVPGCADIGSASYFDHPQHISGEDRNHYFFVDLEAGETVEYEMAYIVYNDIDKDDLYLQFAPFGMGPDVSNYGTEHPDNVYAWFWKVQE